MSKAMPESWEELEALACELSELLDSVAAGAVDGGPLLERAIVALLEDVEAALQGHLPTDDGMAAERRLAPAPRPPAMRRAPVAAP